MLNLINKDIVWKCKKSIDKSCVPEKHCIIKIIPYKIQKYLYLFSLTFIYLCLALGIQLNSLIIVG